VKLLALAKG